VNSSNATGVLFRSRTEITRILKELAHDDAVLSAAVGDEEQLFLTRVLHVDPGGEVFVSAYSQEKQVNNALLKEQSVAFRANKGFWRIEFTAPGPTETVVDGIAAVRFALPQALVQSHRREHPRFRVPSDVSLRCIADAAGVASFEARIVDISRSGIGGMIYDPGFQLSPGTVLKGCRIVIPTGEAIVVDLEVRYTVSLVQPDGGLAQRSGVRFIGEPEGIDKLLKTFVIEFGEGGEAR